MSNQLPPILPPSIPPIDPSNFPKDNDNKGNPNNSTNILKEYGTIILVLLIITIITYIWAIVLLSTFVLPKYIFIISIACLLFGQPWITIILAYIFKGKK